MLISSELCRALNPGHVLYNKGAPRFPAKIAARMFESILEFDDYKKSYSVYDPFCGSGIVLATLQTGYSPWVDRLYGSDMDLSSVDVANRNMDLLNVSGLIDDRLNVLKSMEIIDSNQTLSLRVGSAEFLKSFLDSGEVIDFPQYRIFADNALSGFGDKRNYFNSVDLILTDPPYSKDCNWIDESGVRSQDNLLNRFLESTLSYLAPGGKIGLVFKRDCELHFDGFRVLKELDLSKRIGYILEPEI